MRNLYSLWSMPVVKVPYDSANKHPYPPFPCTEPPRLSVEDNLITLLDIPNFVLTKWFIWFNTLAWHNTTHVDHPNLLVVIFIRLCRILSQHPAFLQCYMKTLWCLTNHVLTSLVSTREFFAVYSLILPMIQKSTSQYILECRVEICLK